MRDFFASASPEVLFQALRDRGWDVPAACAAFGDVNDDDTREDPSMARVGSTRSPAQRASCAQGSDAGSNFEGQAVPGSLRVKLWFEGVAEGLKGRYRGAFPSSGFRETFPRDARQGSLDAAANANARATANSFAADAAEARRASSMRFGGRRGGELASGARKPPSCSSTGHHGRTVARRHAKAFSSRGNRHERRAQSSPYYVSGSSSGNHGGGSGSRGGTPFSSTSGRGGFTLPLQGHVFSGIGHATGGGQGAAAGANAPPEESEGFMLPFQSHVFSGIGHVTGGGQGAAAEANAPPEGTVAHGSEGERFPGAAARRDCVGAMSLAAATESGGGAMEVDWSVV